MPKATMMTRGSRLGSVRGFPMASSGLTTAIGEEALAQIATNDPAAMA